MGSSERPLVGGVRHCPRGVGGSPMGSSAPGPGLPTGPITAFFLEPLLSPLPWSRLSPPGSPGTAMARRLHPGCHQHSLRGPQAACWPRVSPCPSRAPLTCPCPINALPAPGCRCCRDRPSRGLPACLNPSLPLPLTGWEPQREEWCMRGTCRGGSQGQGARAEAEACDGGGAGRSSSWGSAHHPWLFLASLPPSRLAPLPERVDACIPPGAKCPPAGIPPCHCTGPPPRTSHPTPQGAPTKARRFRGG